MCAQRQAKKKLDLAFYDSNSIDPSVCCWVYHCEDFVDK